MQEPLRVAVVGAGITGLAAAHRLVELSALGPREIHVRLMEAGAAPGGVISTLRRDGFLVEEGPDSILTEKPWALQLAERIGLTGRTVGTLENYRRSFVVRRRRLEPTPEGFYLLAPTRWLPLLTTRIFSPLGKLRIAMDLVIPRRRWAGDESLASFVTRRLGREALERVAQPMIGGIYGADAGRLSLQATFPRFLEMERDHGSVIRGLLAAGRIKRASERSHAGRSSGARYALFASFEGGLRELIAALVARLPAGTVKTGARIRGITPTARGSWLVESGTGTEAFDAVILAVPAHEASVLVRPFDEDLARELSRIAYASAATVSIGFRETEATHPMDGMGFVVPALEGLSIVGCTFGHRKYAGRAPAGTALVRAFWCGPGADADPHEILRRTLEDLRPLIGLRGDPLMVHVARWPKSMPHYSVGHLDLVGEIERGCGAHRGLALAGNAYRGVGIPDCVRSGEAAAQAIIEGAR